MSMKYSLNGTEVVLEPKDDPSRGYVRGVSQEIKNKRAELARRCYDHLRSEGHNLAMRGLDFGECKDRVLDTGFLHGMSVCCRPTESTESRATVDGGLFRQGVLHAPGPLMPAPEGRVQVERSVSGTGRRGGWGVLCLCAGCRGDNVFVDGHWIDHCNNRSKKAPEYIILTELSMTLKDMVLLISCPTIDDLPWICLDATKCKMTKDRVRMQSDDELVVCDDCADYTICETCLGRSGSNGRFVCPLCVESRRGGSRGGGGAPRRGLPGGRRRRRGEGEASLGTGEGEGEPAIRRRQRVKREEGARDDEEKVSDEDDDDDVVIVGEKFPASGGDLASPQQITTTTTAAPRQREKQRGPHLGELDKNHDDEDGLLPPLKIPVHRRAPRKASRESIKRGLRGDEEEEDEEQRERATLGGSPRRVVSCSEEFDDAVSKILMELKKICPLGASEAVVRASIAKMEIIEGKSQHFKNVFLKPPHSRMGLTFVKAAESIYKTMPPDGRLHCSAAHGAPPPSADNAEPAALAAATAPAPSVRDGLRRRQPPSAAARRSPPSSLFAADGQQRLLARTSTDGQGSCLMTKPAKATIAAAPPLQPPATPDEFPSDVARIVRAAISKQESIRVKLQNLRDLEALRGTLSQDEYSKLKAEIMEP